MPRPTEKNADDMEKLINEYFDKCAETDEFPDEAGMWLYLEIKPKDIPRYAAKDGVQDLLDIAKMRRESWLTRHMARDPKVAQGCMNALKQEKNGGYADKSVNAGATNERVLRIKMDGVGKGAFG